MVLARLFGATPAADAFYVAFRTPSSYANCLLKAQCPRHSFRCSRNTGPATKQEAWELASAVFTTLLTIVTLVTVVGILVAPWLVQILAPGFQANPAKLALTTLLTRVMFPVSALYQPGCLGDGNSQFRARLRGPGLLAAVSECLHHRLRIICFTTLAGTDPRCGYRCGCRRSRAVCHAASQPEVCAVCCSGFDLSRAIRACGGLAR